jgi:imidazolonepropionase-like amidohydrolase
VRWLRGALEVLPWPLLASRLSGVNADVLRADSRFAVRAPVAFDGEAFLPDGVTVVVDRGAIVQVGPFGVDLADGIAVVEVAGTLLPGLIDSHVHLVADGSPGSLERAGAADDDELDEQIGSALEDQAAAGVTTVVDLGDVRYRTIRHRDLNRVDRPRILASGPPLTIAQGHCHFLGGVTEADGSGLEGALAERVDAGVDVVKVMASGGMLTPGSDQLGSQFDVSVLRRLVDLCHDRNLRVHAHAHSISGIEAAVGAGVDVVEHFTGLSDDGAVLSDALLADMAARHIAVDPTAGWDPALVRPIEEAPPRIRDLVTRLGLTPERVLETRAILLRRLREHGVVLISGLDAGATPSKLHGGLRFALCELHRAGFTTADVLATATSVPAQLFGIAAGRLRPGSSADLVAVDGDLRTSLDSLARPQLLTVRGRRLPA